jgi:hypothetical protein
MEKEEQKNILSTIIYKKVIEELYEIKGKD